MSDFIVGRTYPVLPEEKERNITIQEKINSVRYRVKWSDAEHETIVESALMDMWIKSRALQSLPCHEEVRSGDDFIVGNRYQKDEDGRERVFTFIEQQNTVKYRIQFDENKQEVFATSPLLRMWTAAWKSSQYLGGQAGAKTEHLP